MLKKGCLLVAKPSILSDIYFTRTVILLAEHDHKGSVGFVLNKRLGFTLNELVKDINASFTIYNGGPVEQDNLYFVHNIPEFIPNSIEISDGIYWGGDFETTKHAINNGLISKDNIRFFLGYSGWGSKQLELEIKNDSWIITQNNHKSELLKSVSVNMWKEKIMDLGSEYAIWSNAPENPNLN